MEAIELLAQQTEKLQTTCNEMLETMGQVWQKQLAMDAKFDELHERLFGNGQPGEIQRHKTELAGVVQRVGKLETLQSKREGAATAWGALSGGVMWAIGITLQYIWTRIKMGQH